MLLCHPFQISERTLLLFPNFFQFQFHANKKYQFCNLNIQIPQQRICLNRGSDETALLLDSNASLRQELSVREKSILQCLALGDSNKAIARKVDIAEATVKAHVKTILRKIRAQNRTQAAIWAMNNASQVRMTE